MRSAHCLLLCLVGVTVLAVFGCQEPKDRVSVLEENNARLAADRDRLTTELAAAREELTVTSERVSEAERQRATLDQELLEHTARLEAMKAQQEAAQQSARQTERRLQEATERHAQAIDVAQSASAQAEQARLAAQKRLAELEQQMKELRQRLEQAQQAMREAEEKPESPPNEKP